MSGLEKFISKFIPSFSTIQLDSINFISMTDLASKCHCSKRRIEDTIMTLTEKDLNNLVEDGQAEVVCHFCGKKYHFSKEELVALRNVGLGKVHL